MTMRMSNDNKLQWKTAQCQCLSKTRRRWNNMELISLESRQATCLKFILRLAAKFGFRACIAGFFGVLMMSVNIWQKKITLVQSANDWCPSSQFISVKFIEATEVHFQIHYVYCLIKSRFQRFINPSTLCLNNADVYTRQNDRLTNRAPKSTVRQRRATNVN